MIPGMFYRLFSTTKEHIAKLRNIPTQGGVDYNDLSCVYRRAAQIALLDALLETHRQKHKNDINNLSGKQCLHHMLFTKFRWPISQIRDLSLGDVLLILHDDLKPENFDPAITKYVEQTLRGYDLLFFNDVLEEEWNPGILEELRRQIGF